MANPFEDESAAEAASWEEISGSTTNRTAPQDPFKEEGSTSWDSVVADGVVEDAVNFGKDDVYSPSFDSSNEIDHSFDLNLNPPEDNRTMWDKFMEPTSDDDGGFEFNLNPASPDTIQSEEFTGTMAPTEQGPLKAGTIANFNDPAYQVVMGLIKGGDVAINAISSVPGAPSVWGMVDAMIADPMSVVRAPLRVIDYGAPFINATLAAGEWLTEGAVNAMADVTENMLGEELDIEIKFPRITETFGDFTEPTENEVIVAKESEKRKKMIRDWEYTFKKKNNAFPVIEEVISYAPDALSIAMGAVGNIPKYAALTESLLSTSRAETMGEDEDTAKVMGGLGGYAGAKVIKFFTNSLTPKEVEAINRYNAGDPALKEAHIAILEYYHNSPGLSPRMLKQGNTGNPKLDELLTAQRDRMSIDAYNKFIDATTSIGNKARLAITAVADDFAKNAKSLEVKLRTNASNAWDEMGEKMTSTDKVPSSGVSDILDEKLKYAKPNIQNFAKSVMNVDMYKQQLADISSEIKVLHRNYRAELDTVAEGSAEELALKKQFATEMKSLRDTKLMFEGMEAEGKLGYTALDLIEAIKRLNNKEFLKGGSINVHDSTQRKHIGDIRRTLMDALDTLPEAQANQGLYDKARAASRDLYDTMGYSGGQNKGRDVFTPELGQVIEEQAPAQMKIFEGMMADKPQIFMAKLNNMEGKMPPETLDNMKKVYMESRIKASVVDMGTVSDIPKVKLETFEAQIGPMLDSPDGQKALVELYGKDVYDNLVLVRGISREIANSEGKDVALRRTMSAWIRDIPTIVSGNFSNRISDYMYTKRMLQAYGKDTGFDIVDFTASHLGHRIAGGALGAAVAPEGYEVEGMALGASIGKNLSYAWKLSQTKPGKIATKWVQRTAVDLAKKAGSKLSKTKALNKAIKKETAKKIRVEKLTPEEAKAKTIQEVKDALGDM